MSEFVGFEKIARLNRDCVISEKIDGANAQITITDDGEFLTGSRSRFITLGDDNFAFAHWAHSNKEELLKLGPGTHFGEWWGSGIQRGYGLAKGEKRFSLFNTGRWNQDNNIPSCVSVVPILYSGPFNTSAVEAAVERLRTEGSLASPGFMRPEGVVVYHTASNSMFKVTLEKDDKPKSLAV